MWHAEVVAQGFVQMFAVGLEDVLATEQSFEDGKPSIGQIYTDENEIGEFGIAGWGGLNEPSYQEEYDATHDDGSHITLRQETIDQIICTKFMFDIMNSV